MRNMWALYGHVAKDCRVSASAKAKAKAKGKDEAKPGAKGAGKGKSRFAGACFKCGIVGHRSVECRRGGINDLEENEVDPVDTNEAWLAPIEEYVGQDHDPTWMPEMAVCLPTMDEPYVQVTEPQEEALYVRAPLPNGNYGKLRNTIYGIKGARRRYIKELKKQVEKKEESHEEPRVQVACRWSPPP